MTEPRTAPTGSLCAATEIVRQALLVSACDRDACEGVCGDVPPLEHCCRHRGLHALSEIVAWTETAEAALDRLEAEMLDKNRLAVEAQAQRDTYRLESESLLRRLETTEAERDEARQREMEARSLATAERGRALAAERELDEANVQWHKIRDLHASAITDLRAAEAERDSFKRAYMEQRGMREESDMRLVESFARVAALEEALTLIASGGCAIPSFKCIPGMSCAACIASRALTDAGKAEG